MGFSGASQQAPLSGATAIARLFSISASKEKGGKEKQHKIRLWFICLCCLGLGI